MAPILQPIASMAMTLLAALTVAPSYFAEDQESVHIGKDGTPLGHSEPTFAGSNQYRPSGRGSVRAPQGKGTAPGAAPSPGAARFEPSAGAGPGEASEAMASSMAPAVAGTATSLGDPSPGGGALCTHAHKKRRPEISFKIRTWTSTAAGLPEWCGWEQGDTQSFEK